MADGELPRVAVDQVEADRQDDVDPDQHQDAARVTQRRPVERPVLERDPEPVQHGHEADEEHAPLADEIALGQLESGIAAGVEAVNYVFELFHIVHANGFAGYQLDRAWVGRF